MNEKIKELISQSYEYAVVTTIDPFTQEVVTDYIDGTKPIFNKEKFAELIVKECMAQIKEVKELSLPYNANREQAYEFGYDDGMTVAVRTIEEHFGVEE